MFRSYENVFYRVLIAAFATNPKFVLYGVVSCKLQLVTCFAKTPANYYDAISCWKHAESSS